ncbi:MAG: acyltransferase [Candidatus Hydrogenedentes bacterium]|nr:acyltransferase [Candidatus Hydrogenedentota bacterium]
MISYEVHPRTESAARFYRPELDWLRFLAFSAVFWFHVCPDTFESYWNLGLPKTLVHYLMPLVRVGGHGVDLFFTLSAYLITELLLLERNRTGRVHVTAFYVRRILRIWPLYFAFILTAFPFEVLWGQVPAMYYAALMTFTANWYRVASGMLSSVTGPLWSVSIEEQFYLVWPNLMARIKPKYFAGLLALLVVLTWVYRYHYVHGAPPTRYSVWYNTFARLDCFAMGGLLACALHGRNAVLHRAVRFLLAAIAAGLFWRVGASPNGGYFETSPVWAYPQAAFASVLLILAAVTAPAKASYSPPFRMLSYLGKISYGLYVYHFVGGLVSHYLVPASAEDSVWYWVWRAIAAGVVTLGAAMISYEILEKPFLRMKNKFAFVESRPA